MLLLAGCPAQPPRAVTPAQAQAPVISRSAASAQPLAAVNVQAANAQRNQRLIDQVERSYQSGVTNYRAGRLDAARQDFDFAVDLMLTSGYDLQGDPQLNDEFNHIVDAVNSLEMDALRQGNGFSPKVEAAPVDSATDITFTPNPELVAKLKTELNTTSDLPLVINDQVAGYIGVFSNSSYFRAHMAASLKRVGKYKAMIQKDLQAQGVPQDLIYLAVAESGFQPQALNAGSGAGGMWQFMPFAGAYGLTRNGWFDERFDPEKSSIAYAKYMKTLYDQFGDWYLAMAAYNWGPGNIQRVVSRTGYADFWELYRRGAMPAQTRAYVPQILAAILMAKNPAQYGLDGVVPDPPETYDTETVDYAIDLRLVADLTGSTVERIVELNPALLRLATPNDISYDLHLPAGTKPLFEKRIDDIPEEKRASWRFHVVQAGESLESIADAFHLKAHDVAVVNDMKPGDDVGTGDELLIPVAPAAAMGGIHSAHYTVRRGDTLITVADRFGVTVEELRTWNHLRAGAVPVGKSLVVAKPLRLAPSTHVRSHKAHTGSRKRASGASGSKPASKKAHPASGRAPKKK
jgi:membrane-bound lytic murein transglycosylase D